MTGCGTPGEGKARCKGEGATHFACDCVMERMAKLEKLRIAAEVCENHRWFEETGYVQDLTRLKQALADLREKE